MIRLDTHVVVWLFAGDVERLSELARTLVESQPAVIPPIVQLELTHLYETGRLTLGGADIVGDLRDRIGLQLSDHRWRPSSRPPPGSPGRATRSIASSWPMPWPPTRRW